MTNLNDIIKQAAKAHAKKSTAPDKETPDWIESDFKAGIDYALSNILPFILKGFAEWVNMGFCNDGDLNLWRALGTLNYYTDAELLEKYIQHLQTNKPELKPERAEKHKIPSKPNNQA